MSEKLNIDAIQELADSMRKKEGVGFVLMPSVGGFRMYEIEEGVLSLMLNSFSALSKSLPLIEGKVKGSSKPFMGSVLQAAPPPISKSILERRNTGVPKCRHPANRLTMTSNPFIYYCNDCKEYSSKEGDWQIGRYDDLIEDLTKTPPKQLPTKHMEAIKAIEKVILDRDRWAKSITLSKEEKGIHKRRQSELKLSIILLKK